AERMARAPRLAPWWRDVVDLARTAAAGDRDGAARRFAALRARDLDDHDRLYLEYRWALAAFDDGAPPSDAVALMEQSAARWPHDAAAFKHLLRFYVGPSDRVSIPLALRFGATAVALAPDDVGVRAHWARAQLLSGHRAEAAAQTRIAERVDADDQRAEAV